ncbi:MAG: hypothetical protein B7Z15_11145 [Rhizobiales bacterium 32-66-8]|nr:MAG: hypothetical protein B7Z15_11145 [Rhizobiales bacterium 32-66-8]
MIATEMPLPMFTGSLKKLPLAAVLLAATLSPALSQGTPPAAPPATATAPSGAVAPGAVPGSVPMRDQRYCEVLPIKVSLSGIHAEVYNTMGFGDCPQALWTALSESEVRRHFDATTVIMNGPRYFVMDRIIPSGATLKGEVVTLGGITFEQRAELKLSLRQLETKPYSENAVGRETVYRFDAGQPLFELTAPDGSVYVMQSYARIVDPTLSFADLPGLGAKLKLPEGWSYAMRVPTEPLLLTAQGEAIVIQDSLKNSYQKRVSPPVPAAK